MASCLTAGVASAIGISAMAALIMGLCVPVGTYVPVRCMSGRWTRLITVRIIGVVTMSAGLWDLGWLGRVVA